MLKPNFSPSFNTLAAPYGYSLDLIDETATQQLGVHLSTYIKPGFNLYLQGDLGAGKSTLTRALLRALGVTGTLRSPSYALLEPYEVACLSATIQAEHGILHHFDFYRLDTHPLAWKEAGFANAFEAPHASIVEWPQYALGLPKPTVSIHLQHCQGFRKAVIESSIDLQL